MKNSLDEQNLNSLLNLLYGSPINPKMMNIVISFLDRLIIEKFGFQEMDCMLDLFIILYLKCTKEIQLIFKHDINIILFNIITENSEQLINNGKFTRKVTFFYCQ